MVSVPALAAALRQTDRHAFVRSAADTLLADELVQSYRVGAGDLSDLSSEREAEMAAQTVAQILDRIQRLAGAYGEWQEFDPCAYFDLHAAQADLLVQISERVSTVHVVFHADLLLPSFQTAERFWSQRYLAAYQSAGPDLRRGRSSPYAQDFLTAVQPQMVDLWQGAVSVVQKTRAILIDDLSFLAATGGEAERYRWHKVWQGATPDQMDPALLPPFNQLPTLTLSTTFPLPSSRQPGRIRRLRRRWNRRNQGTK